MVWIESLYLIYGLTKSSQSTSISTGYVFINHDTHAWYIHVLTFAPARKKDRYANLDVAPIAPIHFQLDPAGRRGTNTWSSHRAPPPPMFPFQPPIRLPTFALFLVRVLLPGVILFVPGPVLMPVPLRPIPLLFPWNLGFFFIFIFALELEIFLWVRFWKDAAS